MKLGIKTGLHGNPYQDIDTTHPDFCEIWFHSGKISAYSELLEYIKKSGAGVGLHFWGALDDKTLANFAYPNSQVLHESRELLRKTIDVAAKYNALYVNVHPAGSLLAMVDFEMEEFKPYEQGADEKVLFANLEASFTEAALYAKNRGVVLTLESVPAQALGSPWTGSQGRLNPTAIGEYGPEAIQPLLDNIDNIYFANDFGHTAANMITSNRQSVLDYLTKITNQYAPKTKLLHVSYILPPYNGTDYHGCLYYDEFKSTSAVPNYDEIQSLLKLFVDRDDVCALVEPEKDHPRNFQTLKQLVTVSKNRA